MTKLHINVWEVKNLFILWLRCLFFWEGGGLVDFMNIMDEHYNLGFQHDSVQPSPSCTKPLKHVTPVLLNSSCYHGYFTNNTSKLLTSSRTLRYDIKTDTVTSHGCAKTIWQGNNLPALLIRRWLCTCFSPKFNKRKIAGTLTCKVFTLTLYNDSIEFLPQMAKRSWENLACDINGFQYSKTTNY